jgi:hypothetical protein
MAKKKHLTPFERQKLQKQQKAQYRRDFMDKLKALCIQIGDVSLYNKLPEAEKDMIYLFRGAPLKIEVAKGAKIQKRLVEVLSIIIKKNLLTMQMEVVKGSGRKISYADYFLVGMSLEHSLKREESVFDKTGFEEFIKDKDERVDAYCRGVEDICHFACMIFDEISKKYLYSFKFDIDTMAAHPETDAMIDNAITIQQHLRAFAAIDFRLLQKVIIDTYPLDVRKINIDGEVRPVIQLGIMLCVDSQSKFHPFTISLEEMHRKSHFAKLPLPVYIQQHAINRLIERTGCKTPSMASMILSFAFLRKDITPWKGKRILIACFVKELKIGYLLGEVIQGIILIRTFLLLTNSGTPEGDKLSELTGLQIEDLKYLSIDNLPGLVNSDIEQNENICNLFRTAGCGDILDLCKKMRTEPETTWFLDSSQPKNTISELITEYLRPDVNNEEYVENDQSN